MNIKNKIKNMFIFNTPTTDDNFILKEKNHKIKYDVRNEHSSEVLYVSSSYDKNLEFIEKQFSVPDNNDVVIKKIEIFKNTKAFLVFYDGMVSSNLINLSIINPLLEIPQFSDNIEGTKVLKKVLVHNQTAVLKKYEDILDDINFGNCALFIDGHDVCYSFDVREWEHRGIEKPETEQSLYGPQEAFSEMLRTNSALIRKILKTEHLICEGTKIGKISKTRGVLMYIDNIANPELINEVRRRIDSITTDYVIAIEEVAMLIEEKTHFITPRILATERPDRTARMLSEGRVALILNGSPKALIFPTNAFELMHAASDAYMRYPYSNMTRGIRLAAMLITMLLPAMYLAITLYHQEMIPTFLAYAISAARENVPFPSVIEMLIMDFSFELIRESGIRMPGIIGSTLGIVGGLILGQAAVSAKIVSPLMIIIIAITGIGSFATPDYSLGWSYRILRLIFILFASIFGFYGVAIGIFIYAVFLGSQYSFGVPFLAPLTGGKNNDMNNSIFVNPVWKNENRPDYLSPLKEKQEPKISRKWKFKRKK